MYVALGHFSPLLCPVFVLSNFFAKTQCVDVILAVVWIVVAGVVIYALTLQRTTRKFYGSIGLWPRSIVL